MFKALSELDHMGIAIEPIAAMTDPDDKIEGDYVIRVSFQLDMGSHDDKIYLHTFQASFDMETLRSVSDKRFQLNIRSLKHAAIKESHCTKDDAFVATKDSIIDLGSFLDKVRKAHDESA